MDTITQHKAARVSGLLYLIIILLSILSTSFLKGDLFTGEGITHDATAVLQFRIATYVDVIVYALVVLLAAMLYFTLQPVNKYLALTAMLFRVGEGILGVVVTIISGFIPLQLSNRSTDLGIEQAQVLAEVLSNVGLSGLDVVLLFIGVGGTLFFYLFFQSGYIPKALAAWGILTYISMFVLATISLLIPDHPLLLESILYGQGALFEIIFGFWIMIKGIKLTTD